MVKFLQDPKGDIPWEEDPDAENVVHIDSEQVWLVASLTFCV